MESSILRVIAVLLSQTLHRLFMTNLGSFFLKKGGQNNSILYVFFRAFEALRKILH